jgi:hypothetical protein
MRHIFTLLLLSFCITYAAAQGTKIQILTAKQVGYSGDMKSFEVTFKVVTGKIIADSYGTPMAATKPNGKHAFAYLYTYDDLATGATTISPVELRVLGDDIKVNQYVVSHDLAIVPVPATRSFSCSTNYAFLSDKKDEAFAMISSIKGFAKVGDEITYTNDRGQQGSGKITEFTVEGGYKTDRIFEGIVDNGITMTVQTNGVDLTKATVTLGKMTAAPAATTASKPAVNPKHKIKSIPVNAVLEDKNVRITVHNLVKFNPDSTAGDFDLFKVDYTLDYYIVDATFENKTTQAFDAGEYLMRFNFFSPDGKSADDFTRMFRSGGKPDDVQQQTDVIDTKIFGGSGKVAMSGVMVKYHMTLPDYDTNDKLKYEALYKPIPAGQKIRCATATIMGVPPSYKIVGLGTWPGTFFDKKKLLFTPVKL